MTAPERDTDVEAVESKRIEMFVSIYGAGVARSRREGKNLYWISVDRLAARVVAAERERDEARRGYGAKFNAITAALGHAGEAERLLEDDDIERAAHHLAKAVAILVDA